MNNVIEDRLLSVKSIAKMLDCSTSAVWKWNRLNSSFPSPIKTGGSTRWRLSDIQTWLDSKYKENN